MKLRRVMAIAAIMLLAGCHGAMTPPQSRVQHVIVCWLKSPGDNGARQELIVTSRSFVGEIPGLQHVSGGVVLPSTRPATDSSFDVAVVMAFDSAESLAAYYTHPMHVEAVEKTLKPLVAKYVVYDYVDERGRGHSR